VSAPAVPVVEVAGAHVALAGTEVLTDVDLRIDRGELVALLGANGSGKSTLLRAVVGALPLSSGTAHLLGSAAHRGRARNGLGYVPQDNPEAGSIPTTARETVASGLLGARSWRPRRGDPRVRRALQTVGLEHLADRPITRMSGGQRRRVMIARALAREPEFLVLDEPFAGIDLTTQELLAQLFRDLAAAGTTILVVLHETGPLSGDIHRAVVLDQGRVVHDGPESERPRLDPGHGHAGPVGHIDECLGQEIHPA